MKSIKTTIIAAAVLSAAAFTAQAQPAGFLEVNPDPVALGMAGTGTVLESTPYAMWNNIASTALDEQKFQVGASYTLWNTSADKAAAPGPFNAVAVAGYGRVARFMTVSAGLRYFGGQPLSITSDGVNISQFSPIDLEAGVGFGFRILPILSLGANVNYVHSALSKDAKGGAVSADFGALVDLKFMRIGVTASNIGSKISYGAAAYQLPANVKLGLGTEQHFGQEDKHAVAVNLEGGLTFEESSFFAGLGAQYAYNDMFRVSAGYHYGDADKMYYGSYASVGLGFKIIGISFNAAYLIGTDKNSPLTNTFTLGLGFEF
ncbi:MAG TPA: PorV/PorQ family protein [Candidatus Coprenecus stercoravium]|uniref:PorV/PorQ family protein n=1 Tax=Candidatus Coprenecus stercoravium TaxID=2840735 RepID=A0A9D2GPQ8_9BACT|nr:PorV/PorQ family protein [Candidatus Coprenecus stercoravium]